MKKSLRKFSTEDVIQIKALKEAGLSYRKIAEKFNCNHGSYLPNAEEYLPGSELAINEHFGLSSSVKVNRVKDKPNGLSMKILVI